MLHGRNLIIKIDGTAIAGARSCDITRQCDTIEVSSPLSGKDRSFIPGRTDWQVSTSHLVTTPMADIMQVGSVVELSMEMPDTDARAFLGFVTNVTVRTSSLANPSGRATINFDNGRNIFVIYDGGYYYRTWRSSDADYYITPNVGDLFVNGTDYYEWDGTTLAQVTSPTSLLTGSAICKQCKISGAIGSLAKGSFVWQGSGPLE